MRFMVTCIYNKPRSCSLYICSTWICVTNSFVIVYVGLTGVNCRTFNSFMGVVQSLNTYINEPRREKPGFLPRRKQRLEADQRLCFRYTGSTIPLLSKLKISSL